MANKKTSIKERVLSIAKDRGISYEQFCEGIGMTYGSFKGEQKKTSLNSDAIDRIMSKYPEVDLHWLVTGNEMGATSVHQPIFSYGRKKAIPLLPLDTLESFQNNELTAEEIELGSYTIPSFNDIGVEFLVKVSDSSMSPLYKSGDLIACKTVQDSSFFQWGKPYLLHTPQGYLFKRLFCVDGDEELLLCRSDNQEQFPEFTLSKSSVLSSSVVLGTIRIF